MVKLAVILLEILIFILPLTFFFVYWETLAAQPVPAVPGSQGRFQQLWIAGTTWSWASPFLGGARLLPRLRRVARGGWRCRGRYTVGPRNRWAVPLLITVWTGLKTHHGWGFSYFTWCEFFGTCEAIPLGPSVSFCVEFFPAKLYVKYISTDVGSGEQSMYMHMSDMFSYYFWQYVFSAWNNKFCIALSPLLPLQLLSFSIHRILDFKAGKQP